MPTNITININPSNATVPLPQWVYDDIANPNVTSVVVPNRYYTLPSYLIITRSNLDLDFSGSTLVLYEPTGYPVFADSQVDTFVDPAAPARNASHLTGTITAATTQLTMDAAEIMDLVPGEVVTIVAGTNVSDPVEPYQYITAEVLTVVGQVITFTAPLGVDVTVYPDEAALRAVVNFSLWDKIGPWGEDYIGANYHKGLGTDHGLLRYVGGMNHDITLRNFHLEMTLPTNAAMTITNVMFFRDVLRLSILNWSCMNLFSSLVHTWRCDDVLVDGLTVRGEGKSKIFDPDQIHVGYLMSAWGGTGITYRNVDVQGTNIALANTEVSPADVLFQNLSYDVNFVRNWNYAAVAVVLGFYGGTLGSGVRIEDSTLDISGIVGVPGQNDAWNLDPGNVVTFKNLIIPGSTFGDFFAFNRHIIEGTLTVGGITYGPMVSDTETLVVTAVSDSQRIYFPKGFYKSMRFRITDPGSSQPNLSDGFGNYYNAALTSGAWTPGIDTWVKCVVPTTYLNLLWLNPQWAGGGGGAPMTIEFEIEYYPAPDDAGWVS